MNDLSWLAELGLPGLVIVQLQGIIIFFVKYGLPYLKDIKLNQYENIKKINESIEISIKDRKEIHNKLNNIIENDEKQDKLINTITMETLKQQVWSNSLNIEDRLYAGARYLKMGGNSNTKTKLLELIKGNENLWVICCKSQGIEG